MLTINNTLDGYLKDVEIKGNTIQDIENLADIRSVGDKVEGQELYEIPVLSCGKNIFKSEVERGCITGSGELVNWGNYVRSKSFMRVSPNTNYIGHMKYNGQIKKSGYYVEYDKDFNFIKTSFSNNGITTSDSSCYIKLILDSNSDPCDLTLVSDIQLEEGIVATPYEPYVEDKLTILSPVQLEKVGDVADRIIEKDGVWGVEKNIKTIRLGSESAWYTRTNTSGIRLFVNIDYLSNGISNRVILCDALTVNKGVNQEVIEGYNQILAHKDINYSQNIYISKDFENTTLFTAWLDENPINIKYVTETEPQFIPLPHDQQIKLRTFANKTNISFGCEIEGTIKAQVPKSLGATVNTHTEQISNLNKELDRVKKLEESTVSTVTTESDFTTVEATSNGYFEDVKLEGKTFVNICPKPSASVGDGNHLNNVIISDNVVEITVEEGHYTGVSFTQKSPHMKPNTTYTIVANILENTMTKGGIAIIEANPDTSFIGTSIPLGYKGLFVEKTTTRSAYTLPRIQSMTTTTCKTGEKVKFSLMVLEGDHTQNPPSYFEGLKSVGQDVNEIVVSSVNKGADITLSYTGYTDSKIEHKLKTVLQTNFTIFNPHSNKVTVCVFKNGGWFRDVLVEFGCKYIELNEGESVDYLVQKYEDGWTSADADKINDLFVVTQSDKKRLLYYNNETQTWEKPILREWDSIEKHSDGKYYYHQRSGEVVLNGSEEFYMVDVNDKPNTLLFYTNANFVPSTNVIRDSICDKFTLNKTISGVDEESHLVAETSRIYIRLLKSKLSTQDIEGFKQWLQANNVTVVYQLAEEKVYECTNIDLITYANETNYIVESGVISPKSTLKVHNNISNVVSLLQKKVSLLESNITNYMITQNRMQLASTYSADSVTFKVDYALCSEETEEYNEDLYNLILNNILVGKDNYNYDKMFTMVLDYASWNQISWEQFDILVGLMDMQHNPPTDDEIIEEIPNEIM